MCQHKRKQGNSLPDNAASRYFGNTLYTQTQNTPIHPITTPKGRSTNRITNSTYPRQCPSLHILYCKAKYPAKSEHTIPTAISIAKMAKAQQK